MTQNELEDAVARATGEDVCQIRARGFGPADLLNVDFDPEPDNLPHQRVEWDRLDLDRNVSVIAQ